MVSLGLIESDRVGWMKGLINIFHTNISHLSFIDQRLHLMLLIIMFNVDNTYVDRIVYYLCVGCIQVAISERHRRRTACTSAWSHYHICIRCKDSNILLVSLALAGSCS